MTREPRGWRQSATLGLALLAVGLLPAACGAAKSGDATATTTQGGGTGTGGGGSGGGGTTPPAPNPFAGGVVATFTSAGQQFKAWITEPFTAQALADAWNGTGPAITSICCSIVPGNGQNAHNAPWSWSVPPAGGINFSGICVGCAFAWTTPAQTETGITTGPPYNCNDVNAGATWGMARMVVTLGGLQDHR